MSHPNLPADDADDDAQFWARVEEIVATSVAALAPADVAARVAWCQRTGEHGIRAEEADGTGEHVRLLWGGATLAVVDRAVFADDAYGSGLGFTTMPGAPDDISTLDARRDLR